jgi:hypothetical protein
MALFKVQPVRVSVMLQSFTPRKYESAILNYSVRPNAKFTICGWIPAMVVLKFSNTSGIYF